MKALFDFVCQKCNRETEKFIDNEITEIDCECGEKATKGLTCPSYFKIDGFRADIMSEKWAKTRIDNAKKHAEHNES